MRIELYDLAGAEDARRYSPTCWRMTLALAHRGLAAKSIPWRSTEKDVIAFSGQGAIPVRVDGHTLSPILGASRCIRMRLIPPPQC